MNKIIINILYDCGIEREYEMIQSEEDVTEKDLNDAVEFLKTDYINKSFKSGSNGYLEFNNKEGESVSVNLSKVTEVKLKIT